MTIGEYTLAKQKGNRGYYARICLEIVEESVEDLVVEFASNIASRWRPAVYFGVSYAWDYFIRINYRPGGLKVVVTEVDWRTGDSTNAGVAFASLHAFWIAVDFLPENAPFFDVESARYSFPN